MQRSILIVGGGIGGLTAAIALRRQGFAVHIVERDPQWSVYGVGIIQQMNVLRAMKQIGVLDAYLSRAHGFDRTTIFVGPGGVREASFETPRLAGPDYPSNAGIRRTDLQQVLGDAARAAGADIRLGVTVAALEDDGAGVNVTLSDGTSERHDVVIGADGIYSRTRATILPDALKPRYTGQWVWRYNLPLAPDLDGIHIFAGPCNAGLVPMSESLMYLFLVSEEPANDFLPVAGAAAAMRSRANMPAPQLQPHLAAITEDAGVVARPIETVFLDQDPWHVGRVALLGDAVHASSPHLAQGAGMAIEDGIVLAEELSRHDAPEAAFSAYRARRIERVRHVVQNSLRIGEMQMGKVPPFDVGALTGQTIRMMAGPI